MFRSFWRLFARSIRSSGPARSAARRLHVRPGLEALEDRCMPNATTIAGFVYNDSNANGIKDAAEVGIANDTVELHRADGSLVATTTTDANGHYTFENDPTINVTPQTKEVDATFASQPTDWTNPQSVAQFDPSLGTLTSVDIISQGNLTTHVQVENAAPSSSMTSQSVNADVKVVGQFTVTADGFGTLVQSSTDPIDNQTVLGPFDGTSDFQGPSSHDFGAKQATASGSTTFDASSTDLSAFIGTGSIQLSESAAVSSSDTGSGNFDQRIRSQADGSVRIIYHYLPSTGLKPGDYTVKQATEPDGFLDGKTTSDNITPNPNSLGVNVIAVHLDGTNSSLTNNFAEVAPASLAGNVYHDLNANGSLDVGEPGLVATVALSGTDVNGQAVNLTKQANADGSYSFDNLWSSSDYTITETTLPTGGYLAPSESVGSQGGVVGASAITQINLNPGVNGVNNNFGHVLPSSLAGFVYVDPNNNGIKEAGELPLNAVAMTLSGTDNLGNQVFQTTTTTVDGSYHFDALRPGTYTISKVPPLGYINGIDTPGSLGGTTANDQLFVNLGENKNGTDYNFAELTPPIVPPPITPVPPVVPQGPGTPIPPPEEPPLVPPPLAPPSFGKWWFLS